MLFSPQLGKISDLRKPDRHLRGFWRGLGAFEASLSKKKEPCFARGRGAEEGQGVGDGGAAASQTNHPSVIIEVLRLMID